MYAANLNQVGNTKRLVHNKPEHFKEQIRYNNSASALCLVKTIEAVENVE
jgi:hypothetical protein